MIANVCSRADISTAITIGTIGIIGMLGGCSRDDGATESGNIRRVSTSILGGRPSKDDENANVFIRTEGETALLQCSGRIVAPGLVLTARHCLLKRKSMAVRCNPDGSPKDLSDTTDVRPEPPEKITVFVGSQKPNLRPIAVREVITNLEVTICRSDMGFLVLQEPGLNPVVRIPFRREPVRIGELVSVTGWGYTSDGDGGVNELPTTRSTILDRRITEIGPGLIPDGTFAIGGSSVCHGDSGASALIDGAVVGTYSRIDGEIGQCSLEYVRNIFANVPAHAELIMRAYAAIGEEPWYVGERPPWLSKPGSPCTKDEECRSAVCDVTTRTCVAPCGGDAGGVACVPGEVCSAGGLCVASSDDAGARSGAGGEDESGSCAIASPGASTGGSSSIVVMLLGSLIATVSRRHRRRRRERRITRADHSHP